MAQGDKVMKIMSLPEKKDVANTAHKSIRRQVEESNSMMERMEAMEAQQMREYMLQKKATLSSQMKATIKRLLRKDMPKQKKRTMLSPILGAVLKCRKDDDVDPAAPGAVGAAA